MRIVRSPFLLPLCNVSAYNIAWARPAGGKGFRNDNNQRADKKKKVREDYHHYVKMTTAQPFLEYQIFYPIIHLKESPLNLTPPVGVNSKPSVTPTYIFGSNGRLVFFIFLFFFI